MTRDDIVRMAKEAGFTQIDMYPSGADVWIDDGYYVKELERFAALVSAAEREACALVCDKQSQAYMSSEYTTDPLGGFRERFAAEQCAAAIRARGEKEQPR